jgi:AGZA family xanthine/uracil permease-like MFS transporter
VGLGLIVWLQLKKNPFAFLVGIFSITLLNIAFGFVHLPASFVSAPDFSSVFFKLDWRNSLSLALAPSIFAFLFTDFFDSLSTLVGVANASGLIDKNGDPKNLKEGLIVDSLATLTAGVFGTSSGTAFIESAAGIEVGGRSGWSAAVTALCFLPCFFLAPLLSIVPAQATAPVLIVVGAFMFRSISQLETKKFEELMPAFLTLVMIPLCFSITQGILWGFISHVFLFCLAGRRKEIHPLLWGLSLISILMIVVEQRS